MGTQRKIVIAHEGVPKHMSPEDVATYFDILVDTIRWWKLEETRRSLADRGVPHEVVVVFPTKSKGTIADLLAGRQAKFP